MRARTIAAIAVVVAIAPSPLLAQGLRKWWTDQETKAELALTDHQSAQIEEIFQATLPKLRAGRDGLERLEADLSRLIEGSADEATVSQQVDRVEAARSEMGKLRTMMLFRMHRVLSAEQRVKLKALHERGDRDRDRRRSGGRSRF